MKSLKILFALLMGTLYGMASDDYDSFKGELAPGTKYTFDLLNGGTVACELEELAGHKVLIKNFETSAEKSDALLCILCDLQNEKGYKIVAEPTSEIFFCDTESEDALLIQHGFRKLADSDLPTPLVAVGGKNIYVREQRVLLPSALPDGRKGRFII